MPWLLGPPDKPGDDTSILPHPFCFPFAASIACHTRFDVSGMSTCFIPYSASASATAFITEVSAPAQPASPQPLVPSGLDFAGTGWLPVVKNGTTDARGSA